MKDSYRVICISDPHVGMDAFGATEAEWDAPFREAVQYAVDVEADAFLIAGDAYHKRNPTMAEHDRMADIIYPLKVNAIPLIVAAGNHDIGNARDSVCAGAFMYGEWHDTAPLILPVNDLDLLAISWPRPSLYGKYMRDDPEEAISVTRDLTLDTINMLCRGLNADRPLVAFGHAMVSYSGAPDFIGGGEEAVTQSMPPDPGLQFGKDVVLPYEWLVNTIPGPLFLGHVHDPEQPGYVGSTQPTDWSEAGQQKRFVDLRIERCEAGCTSSATCFCTNGWLYHAESILYTTTLRLYHIREDWSEEVVTEGWEEDLALYPDPAELTGGGPWHSIRADITVPQGSDVTPDKVRAILGQHCRKVGPVNVTPVRRHSARVETATPLVRQTVPDGVRAWLESRETPESEKNAALAALDEVLPEVTEG